MPTYAIGDIHGCFEPLQRLLSLISYDPQHDSLWLVGDLVNRGPQSTEVLRWAVGEGDRITAVLGNHDLHLLARAHGVVEPRPKYTIDQVLQAPDGPELIEWLSQRPLIHREGDLVMIHAGLMPSWTVDFAESLAREVEAVLRGPQVDELLAEYHRSMETRWREGLVGLERSRVALAAFTLLRTCSSDGTLAADYSGPLLHTPDGCKAWFLYPERKSREATIVFGHWAALGLHIEPGVYALDSGCVWNNHLSAVRLDDGKVFVVPRFVEGFGGENDGAGQIVG